MAKHALLPILSLIAFIFCLHSPVFADVDLVREGKLSICPKKTVEQMVSGFIENPKWSLNEIKDEQQAVVVSGKVIWQGKKTPIKILFVVNPEKKTFIYEAIKIGDEQQPRLVGNGVLLKMCAN